MIENFSLAAAYRQCGFTYLGATRQSAKMRYSYNAKCATYCIYIAPSNMAALATNMNYPTVCPNDEHCKQFCLNGSGQNKCDTLARGVEGSLINQSRIKKTRLFYDNRELFMRIMIAEITREYNKAQELGMMFAVRINGTSDLSPLAFHHPNVCNDMNILEIFPYIQFYDYTKVKGRTELQKKYPNYDVTLSYNGYNWEDCKNYLDNGGKVAVVFENEKELPILFRGYPIHDANSYDMRFLDPEGHIMGLHFHRVAANYVNGKYVRPNTKFIVAEDSNECVWNFDKNVNFDE